jgi:hypothetical protein
MRNVDQSRPNLAMALIVDHGIAMAETQGKAKAVAYLTARGVPDAVIARVLCEPERRRGSGALSAPPARPSALEQAA